MLARADTVATIAEKWLAQFERALAAPSRGRLETLFHADSHWRDVLALTWRIKTVSGADAILRELVAHAGRARPTGFRLDPHRTAPRNVTRAGTDAIEAIFSFETAQGRGSGVLRLTGDAQDANAFRAWSCSPRSTKSRDTRNGSGQRDRKARPIRATFADRTGSTCARPPPNMPTAIPRYSWWAADRPGFRLPLASRNWASTR
jgi:hypothetical protein